MPDAIKAMMDAETWMSGSVAVEKGFATAVVNQSDQDVAQAKGYRWHASSGPS